MYRTVVRHLAGAAGAWLTFCVEGVVTYLGLLGYAWATGANPGGPLAGPAVVLAAAVAGGALTLLVLLPSVAVAEVTGRLRWLTALGAAGTLLGLITAGWSAATGVPAGAAAVGWLIVLAAVALPLAVWFTTAAVVGRVRSRASAV